MNIFARALMENSDLNHYENMEQQMHMQTHQLCQLDELQTKQMHQDLSHEVGSALSSATDSILGLFL